MSAGTTAPSCSSTTSPGTSPVTSSSTGAPPLIAVTRWRIDECSASAARSARYSLAKPSPMLAARMVPMISASVRSPSTYETTAVTSSSTSSALRSWWPRTPRARAWWVRTALGPYSARRRFASAGVSPSGPVPSAASTAVASRVAAVTRSVPEAAEGATFTVDRVSG